MIQNVKRKTNKETKMKILNENIVIHEKIIKGKETILKVRVENKVNCIYISTELQTPIVNVIRLRNT